MSRLPNAPLLEVLFELRWELISEDEKSKYQYLHGDLYNELKHKYPQRESIFPSHLPVDVYLHQVAHRFRSESGYPLIQVGPGVFTVNTNDENYIWEEYQQWVQDGVKALTNLEYFNQKKVSLSLKYFDFLLFDYQERNIKDFLKDNLHINVEQDFFKTDLNPHNISLAFTYGTHVGTLNVGINRAQNNLSGKEGIIIQIEVSQNGLHASESNVGAWLNAAHALTRETFVEMTKGKLQESFKSN